MRAGARHNRRMSDEEAVRDANRRFYEAFAARDLVALEALLARRAPSACIHPGWPPLVGRAEVLASWEGILGSGRSPSITFSDVAVHLLGEAAYVVCIEHLPGGHLVATNVFVREDGVWKMSHHQAGAVADVEGNDEEPPEGGTLH